VISGLRLFNSSELAITLADLLHNPPKGRQWDILGRRARFSEGIPAHIGILIAVASVAAAVMFRAAGFGLAQICDSLRTYRPSWL
jgi:hypothetical protein